MSKFIITPTNDSSFLLKEAKQFLGLNNLETVKQYEVFESNEQSDLSKILPLLPGSFLTENLDELELATSFRYRQVLGQYDEVEEMTNRILNNLREQEVTLHHSRIIDLPGLNEKEVATLESKKAKADAKAAEEAKKTEAEAVLKKLLASGMSADEILEKLK